MMVESEYLKFIDQVAPRHFKTKIITVHNKSSGNLLGVIKWYGAWRQYCFYPEHGTIFNRGCMEDIIKFINDMMEARKSA